MTNSENSKTKEDKAALTIALAITMFVLSIEMMVVAPCVALMSDWLWSSVARPFAIPAVVSMWGLLGFSIFRHAGGSFRLRREIKALQEGEKDED